MANVNVSDLPDEVHRAIRMILQAAAVSGWQTPTGATARTFTAI
jgi:hypothetical protein